MLKAIAIVATMLAGEVDLAMDPAMRHPVVRVPVQREPHVDGVPRKGEWTQYAGLSDLVVSMGDEALIGYAAPEPTEVRVAYSEKGLAVAFIMQMEPDTPPKRSVTEGRDRGFNDDAFEIILQPHADSSRVYHFGGTAAGVTWERIVEGEPDWTWNPDVRYAAFVDEGNHFWSGEWLIPWDVLDMNMPQVGDTIRCNFAANRRSPRFRLDVWSHWKKWWDQPNNGMLIFGGESAAMMMMDPTREAFNGKGAWPAVSARHHSTDAPAEVDYHYRVYRRADSGSSFNKALQTRRDEATGEGATFATLEQDLSAVLSEYEVVRELRKTERVPAAGWTGPWGDRIRLDQPGDYVLAYRMRDLHEKDERNQLLAAGATPFRIRVGIGATVWPHLLTRGSAIVETDLRAISEIDRVTHLRAGIGDLTQVRAERTDDRAQVLELPVAELQVGEYIIDIEALDGEGNVVSAMREPLTKPAEPDWWTKRDEYGAEPEVPKPWTPIAWGDRVGAVWGRAVTFGESALPQQIVNQGATLLAAPMSLELHTSGVLRQWNQVSFEVIEQRPGHVTMQSVREAAGVRVTTRSRFEFDGFTLVDLTIEPTGESAAIDGLEFVMPVRTEHAAFLTNYRNAPGPGAPIRRHVGPTPERYVSPVMLTTWLGTDTLGLEWSSESSRGWYLNEPDEAIVVTREGARTTAAFRLIDSAMTLDGARHIRFGLIATPTKPVDPKWRNWKIDGLSYWPPVPGKTRVKGGPIATDKDVVEWDEQYGMIDVSAMLLPLDWAGYNCWHPHVTDAAVADVLRTRMASINAKGILGLWNGGWAVAPYAPQWDPWGKEMVARPLAPTFVHELDGTYTGPYTEFTVGSWYKNVRDFGLHGIRFDTIIPWKPSANPYLGETWTPDQGLPGHGKTFGTQALFRQREWVKRLYRSFQHHGQPGVFWLGIAGPPIMACESFVTIHEIAEGFYMNAASVKEAYPQDMVRPWMTHRAYGFVEINNIKGSPLHAINRVGPLLVADASPRMSGRNGFNESTYTPTRDYGVPTHRIWESWQWIDRATSQWHPHWNNADLITSTSAGNEHYASLHLQPGKRVLLVVANYEKRPIDVTLNLDRAALGFAPDAPLAARDAVTHADVDLAADAMALHVLSENFRLICIAAPQQLP